MSESEGWIQRVSEARELLGEGDVEAAVGVIEAASEEAKALEGAGRLEDSGFLYGVVHAAVLQGTRAGQLTPEFLLEITIPWAGALRGVRAWSQADEGWRATIAELERAEAATRFEGYMGYGWFLHEWRDPRALEQLAAARHLLAEPSDESAELLAWFHVVRSHAHLVDGDPSRALNDTHCAAEFLPSQEGGEFVMILDVRVGALLRLSRFEEAQHELDRVLRLLAADPDCAEFRREGLQAQFGRHRARLLLQAGQPEEALAEATRAAEVFERHMVQGIWLGELERVEAVVTQARAQYALGDREDAERSFEKAIDCARRAIAVGRLSQPELGAALADAAFCLEGTRSTVRLAEAREVLLAPILRRNELLALARRQLVERSTCPETLRTLLKLGGLPREVAGPEARASLAEAVLATDVLAGLEPGQQALVERFLADD